MSGYKAHLAGGAVAGGAAWAVSALWLKTYVPGAAELALLAPTALLGALFPDTDTDSRGQNIFYALMAGLDITLIAGGHYQWAALLGLLAMLPALGRHRGWTHAWWAAVVVPAPLLLVPPLLFHADPAMAAPFFAAAAIGYASHLVLDKIF